MFMQRQPLKTLYVHISRSNRYCTGNNLPIVTLFTKDDCSLCDKAVEELKPFKHQFVLEKVDITKPENKEWYKKYRYDIPVFHLNGEFLMKHKSDLKLFQERIAQLEQNANK